MNPSPTPVPDLAALARITAREVARWTALAAVASLVVKLAEDRAPVWPPACGGWELTVDDPLAELAEMVPAAKLSDEDRAPIDRFLEAEHADTLKDL